jgi:hypothetical protein
MTTATEREQNEAQANAQVAGFKWLGRLQSHAGVTDFPRRLDERIDEVRERESEGVLEIAIEKTVRIVLGTGGPHTEIVWTEDKTPRVVCYGWFGADRYERDLDEDERAGLESALGDWEMLAGEYD